MGDETEGKNKKWTIEVKPMTILEVSTLISFIGYIVFLSYSIGVAQYTSFPSLSAMIAHSRFATISYTFLVFIHGYGVFAYLIIISGYIGKTSRHFMLISSSAFLYLSSLIVVSYLPIQEDDVDPHNWFAFASFGFALLTVVVHKHTFINFNRRCPIDFRSTERVLVASELFIIVTSIVMAILFWQTDIIPTEYVFIALLILDKYLKVLILNKSELINLDVSILEYSYYTLPGRKIYEYHGIEDRPVKY